MTPLEVSPLQCLFYFPQASTLAYIIQDKALAPAQDYRVVATVYTWIEWLDSCWGVKRNRWRNKCDSLQTQIERSGAGRGVAARPAACDLNSWKQISENISAAAYRPLLICFDWFISTNLNHKRQFAPRRCVCVCTLKKDLLRAIHGQSYLQPWP
jgi:hypothetical protein